MLTWGITQGEQAEKHTNGKVSFEVVEVYALFAPSAHSTGTDSSSKKESPLMNLYS